MCSLATFFFPKESAIFNTPLRISLLSRQVDFVIDVWKSSWSVTRSSNNDGLNQIPVVLSLLLTENSFQDFDSSLYTSVAVLMKYWKVFRCRSFVVRLFCNSIKNQQFSKNKNYRDFYTFFKLLEVPNNNNDNNNNNNNINTRD